MFSQADRLHQLAQENLQQQVTNALMALAQTIPLDRTAEIRAAYAQATARTVAAGQWQAGRLAQAYIGAYVPFVRDPDLADALDGRLMTPDDPGALVGLLRTWTRLDEGAGDLDARAEGGSLAADLAEGDLQAANRASMDEACDAAEREPRFAMINNAGACPWCQLVSGGGAYRYHSAETLPFHTSCKCTPAPEF